MLPELRHAGWPDAGDHLQRRWRRFRHLKRPAFRRAGIWPPVRSFLLGFVQRKSEGVEHYLWRPRGKGCKQRTNEEYSQRA